MIQAPALELSSKAIEGGGLGGVGVTTITTNPGGRVNLTGQKRKEIKMRVCSSAISLVIY